MSYGTRQPRCPSCGSSQIYTIDSRPRHGGLAVARRRKCATCNGRWSTIEDWSTPQVRLREVPGKANVVEARKRASAVSR